MMGINHLAIAVTFDDGFADNDDWDMADCDAPALSYPLRHAYQLQAADWAGRHAGEFPEGLSADDLVFEVTDICDDCGRLAALLDAGDIERFAREVRGIAHVASVRVSFAASC